MNQGYLLICGEGLVGFGFGLGGGLKGGEIFLAED